MKQHLIAIDLDGTTLNNQSKLTPTTIKTLQTLSRQGHLVSIVTGRPYLISGHLYDQIGLKTPMINFNGALGHIPHRKWAGEYAVNVTREMTLDLLAHKQELGIKMVIAEDKYHVWADHPSSDLPEFLPAKLAPEQILNRGVAMKNAVDDIKQIADDVTPLDNDHDGLAKYLQDYFHLDAAKLQLAE